MQGSNITRQFCQVQLWLNSIMQEFKNTTLQIRVVVKMGLPCKTEGPYTISISKHQLILFHIFSHNYRGNLFQNVRFTCSHQARLVSRETRREVVTHF